MYACIYREGEHRAGHPVRSTRSAAAAHDAATVAGAAHVMDAYCRYIRIRCIMMYIYICISIYM